MHIPKFNSGRWLIARKLVRHIKYFTQDESSSLSTNRFFSFFTNCLVSRFWYSFPVICWSSCIFNRLQKNCITFFGHFYRKVSANIRRSSIDPGVCLFDIFNTISIFNYKNVLFKVRNQIMTLVGEEQSGHNSIPFNESCWQKNQKWKGL